MDIRSLGLAEYEEVWALQRELAQKRAAGEIADTLILCEHPGVYTRGVSSKAPVPSALPYPLHTVERGGDLTYHGPGQLVGYPILRLEDLGLRPRSYLRALEETLAASLVPLGVQAEALRGFTGLWARGKKIASLGVAVQQGVAFHGFALNVRCDLRPFHAIYPCNLQPDQLTNLETVLSRVVSVDEVSGLVAEAFGRRFSAVLAAA
jgi:lipoyl(octanoyl) transferase